MSTSFLGIDEEIITDEEIPDHWKHYYPCLEDDESVKILIDRERNFGHFDRKHDPNLLNEWIKSARMDAIDWILTSRAAFGFRFQTACLSVVYFDRFLSIRSINSESSWAIKLLSLACVSLAAKMEEPKVPALCEFQVEDFHFQGRVIQRMELLVLNTLEWKMGSITPFAFLHHFVSKMCCHHEPNTTTSVIAIAIKLIFGLIRVTSSMIHRPSAVAAAAALMAMDQGLTKNAMEDKLSSISSHQFLQIEDVFECYWELQRLESEKEGLKPPDLWPPTNLRSSSTASGSKRKRLQFDKSEPSCNQ